MSNFKKNVLKKAVSFGSVGLAHFECNSNSFKYTRIKCMFIRMLASSYRKCTEFCKKKNIIGKFKKGFNLNERSITR